MARILASARTVSGGATHDAHRGGASTPLRGTGTMQERAPAPRTASRTQRPAGHGTCSMPSMMRLSRAPPLRALRAFCAAARHRSFKFAADELCLTPSAVSHQMKELETALGTRLFERKTRALELTTAAHRLLDEVEPLLEALDRTLAQMARRNGRQTLRIRLPALFASELFIPRLASFCAENPQVDVQLDTRDPRPAAHPVTADVSIVLADAP